MPDLSRAQRNALYIAGFVIGDHRQKPQMRKVVERGKRIRMPQHGSSEREHDQRFSPLAQRLPPQEASEDCPALRAGTFWKLSSRRCELQSPLRALECSGPCPSSYPCGNRSTRPQRSHSLFARAHKLINDRLRHIGEVSKLRFPKHQRLGSRLCPRTQNPSHRFRVPQL